MSLLFYSLSILALLLLAAGLWARKNRRVHPPLMLGAFLVDIGNVLAIELSRQAVEKVVGLSIPVFTWIHVLISVGVVILYGIMIVLGVKLYKGNEAVRPAHKFWAKVFIVFRLANFITSLAVPFKPF